MGEICSNCFSTNYTGGVCPDCGYDPREKAGKYPLALPSGSILYGKYRTGRVLGQGGFGITYKAQDVNSGEIVAIKEFFPKELATRDNTYSAIPYGGQRAKDFEYGKAKFIDEARTLAKFTNLPNIVDIYNYFEENGTAYFTMEYAGDENLEKYIAKKGGKLTYEEAQAVLIPVFNDLAKIHAVNVVHRDIAPDNIMITPEGRPVLIDFGAAKDDTGMKSVSMDVVVKYGFAPIEQYKRHTTLGPTTDIYAAAATYYYAITGRIPPESVDRIGGEDPLLPPSAYGAQIDKEVEDALFKALSVQPADRYQSMEAFIDGVSACMPSVDWISRSHLTTVPKMLERAFDQLSQKEWAKADVYLDMVLENEPQNAEAYVGKLMCELKVEQREFLEFVKNKKKIKGSNNYKLARKFGDGALQEELDRYVKGKERGGGSSTDKSKNLKKLLIPGAAVIAAIVAVIICINVFSSWSYSSSSGTLTIKDMEKYSGLAYGEMPWAKYFDDATAIVVKDGVDAIVDNAFYDFKLVESVELPSSVTEIGSWAFRSCKSLTNISLRNVTSIGENAFRDCESLSYITLGSSLGKIGVNAFKDCGLKSVSYSGNISAVSVASGNDMLLQAISDNSTQENLSVSADLPSTDTETSGGTEITSVSTDGLIYSADVIDIPASDYEYNNCRLNARLVQGQDYTLEISGITSTNSDILGACVAVWDFTNNSVLSVELISPVNFGNNYISFHTPDSLGADADVVLYAGIPPYSVGVQMSYLGVQLYAGTKADPSSLIVSTETPANILTLDSITIPAVDATYNTVSICSTLIPGQVYTLCIDNISASEMVGAGIAVYDFTNSRGLCVKLLDLTVNNSYFKWTFTVPQDIGADTQLLLYAGIPGKCNNIEMTYTGVNLYTGVV